MSNSFFIALTLGMVAVTFLIRFSFIGLAGKIQMSSRVSKTLRFVPVTVLPYHHHDSDPERELQHGVRFEKPEGDRRDYLHARQLPPGPGLGRRQRRRFTGFAQLFHVITYQKESTE